MSPGLSGVQAVGVPPCALSLLTESRHQGFGIDLLKLANRTDAELSKEAQDTRRQRQDVQGERAEEFGVIAGLYPIAIQSRLSCSGGGRDDAISDPHPPSNKAQICDALKQPGAVAILTCSVPARNKRLCPEHPDSSGGAARREHLQSLSYLSGFQVESLLQSAVPGEDDQIMNQRPSSTQRPADHLDPFRIQQVDLHHTCMCAFTANQRQRELLWNGVKTPRCDDREPRDP